MKIFVLDSKAEVLDSLKTDRMDRIREFVRRQLSNPSALEAGLSIEVESDGDYERVYDSTNAENLATDADPRVDLEAAANEVVSLVRKI